jgi:subtilisin family serine protease
MASAQIREGQSLELIVRSKLSAESIASSFPQLKKLPLKYLAPKNTYLFSVSRELSKQIIYELRLHREIDLVEINYKEAAPFLPKQEFFLEDWSYPKETNYTPLDPKYPKQWAHHHEMGIDLPKAWELTKGSRDIVIAVIDSGVDYLHEDLADNIWVNEKEKNGLAGVDDDGNGYIDDIHGYDFKDQDPDPMDAVIHGTHCAGIIGAVHNELGVAGVMKKVSIMPLKYFDQRTGAGPIAAAAAVDYAVKMGADIISASWGTSKYSEVFKQAIKRAGEAGIPYVVATPNSKRNIDYYKDYPTRFGLENVITVTSHNKNGKFSSFSSRGVKTVDISAPGTGIFSTIKNGKYAPLSGTSMAAPLVSGSIGLLFSLKGKIPMKELKKRLCLAADSRDFLQDKVRCKGSLNTYRLLTIEQDHL